MFIHYTRYEDKYFDDLKEITLTSFTLTSFNTDKKIPHAKAKQIAWELWCKPVLLSDKKKYCAVALLDEKAIGYIIYGANAFYSKILGIKIGSIILTAVHKKYQGKHKIGQTLLQYVLNIYDKFNIRFITVGTDMDNAPAFLNYIKSQFLPVLFWSTFRFYPEKKIKRTDDVTIIEDPKISEKQLEQFNRPLSFLMDKRVPVSKKKKLEQANRKKIRADITD
ncbi:MAG: GNAT family N-acetyltransferase, partial [Spirochaetes bacterium]|nr:GNAT family N-acetyltransferase [Spirochaetota bacterium]